MNTHLAENLTQVIRPQMYRASPLLIFGVADAGRVRLRHRGAPSTLPGHGGNWQAAFCGHALFKKESLVSSQYPVSADSCLTINETAARLRVCRRTLEREILTGRLKCLRFGRAIRILESDLQAYLETSRVSTPPANDL